MSKNYWQTRRQTGQLQHGGHVTSKIEAWVRKWEERCYSEGIPDEVPDGLLYSGRVPSWKAVAMALLRNDWQLRALGFAPGKSDAYEAVVRLWEYENGEQTRLFP